MTSPQENTSRDGEPQALGNRRPARKGLPARERRPHVWTLAEIVALPEFGDGMGWFYALVRHHETGKIRLCEVLPGMGFADPWPLWAPRAWVQVVRDLWRYRPSTSPKRSIASNATTNQTTMPLTASNTNATGARLYSFVESCPKCGGPADLPGGDILCARCDWPEENDSS